MLNTLRTEEARLRLSLWRQESSEAELTPVLSASGVYQPQLDELIYLRTTITNLAGEAFILSNTVCALLITHSHIPEVESRTFTVNLALDPAQYVLYEGVLSDIPVGRLSNGQSYSFDTPLTFVSCGRFELSGVITDPRHVADSDRLGSGTLKAVVHP